MRPKTQTRFDFNLRQTRIKGDIPLVLIIVTLVLFGSLMVYSASWDFSWAVYNSSTYMFMHQMVMLTVGIIIAAGLAFTDYHVYKKLAVPGLLVVMMSLVAVLLISETRYGAARSLFGGSYQPSELAKLGTIVYLSVWLNAKREVLSEVGFGLFPLAIILGGISGLIFLQPDISAAATIIILGGLMFFLAGAATRQILTLLIITIVIGILVVKVSPTGSERISSYLDGLQDPMQSSYHVRRSLESFVKGGWFGVGIGKAETKLTGLPVPPTDSIFAVIGEETGAFGAALLILLYIMLLWRGINIAINAPDKLGSLLASGVTLWILVEALVNMAVMVGLLPFAGNALPFISYGGSNLIFSLAGIGILLNISRLSEKEKEIEELQNSAFIGKRWRDRRRSLSRPRRSTSS